MADAPSTPVSRSCSASSWKEYACFRDTARGPVHVDGQGGVVYCDDLAGIESRNHPAHVVIAPPAHEAHRRQDGILAVEFHAEPLDEPRQHPRRLPAAGSLVLLGDPRQLDQPIQGVHPPGADVSALGHLLGESATVDPSRGVFLDQTWRMHPDICAFTTEQFYEGRLHPEPELRRQTGGRDGAAGRSRPALHARGACRQHERLGRRGRMRRGADP